MKIKKYIAMMLLACAAGGTFTACSDDETLGEAPRLFRPVASLTVENNNIVVDWENIKGATSYALELYRVTGTDDATGKNIYESYTTVSCTSSPYTFTGLNWDEKYMVKIKCEGENKSSELYQTSDVNVTYVTKITDLRTIDTSARLMWDEGGSVIKTIKVEAQASATGGTDEAATPATAGRADEAEPILVSVSQEDYEKGYKDILNLTPETKYTFTAYSDTETLDNSTYAGKKTGTTEKPEDFNALYGDNYLDIRGYEDEVAKGIFLDATFWSNVNEDMAIIVRGDFEYDITSDVKFSQSVTFRTAATLGGNARFISDGAMGCTSGANVKKLSFVNIDFYGKGWQPGGENSVTTTDKQSFSGKQVFNENKTGSTVEHLSFNGCNFEGYRSVVRAQDASDNVQNVTFTGCTFNGIGDQGVVTTSNKKADFRNITFTDCTITNIVMLTELRSTASPVTVNVENCTFCYAPIGRTGDTNAPMFRNGSNSVTINVTNSVFGPSMLTGDGKGGKIAAYTAGAGSIFYDKLDKVTLNVSNSFKTNFSWTAVGGEAGTTYPFDNLQDLGVDEATVWQNPTAGDYKVLGTLPAGVGAVKWQQE